MGNLIGNLLYRLGQSRVGQAAFTWLVEKFAMVIWSAIRASIQRELDRRRIKLEAEKSIKPLVEAKTKEEIDAATDDALDGF